MPSSSLTDKNSLGSSRSLIRTTEDVYLAGQKYMRRENRALGVLTVGGPEDRRFCSHFGAGANVVLAAWVLLIENDLLPLDSIFDHLLWALLFMKLYPENEPDLCGKLGCSEKTARKNIWPMIDAISELGYYIIILLFERCLSVRNPALIVIQNGVESQNQMRSDYD